MLRKKARRVRNIILWSEQQGVLNSKGDVNNDGAINADDRELLHKWLVRLIGDNELDMENADVNLDGKVDILDLVELSKLCKPESGSSEEETFDQHIGEDSEILSEINTDDNAFKVSLDITASGDVSASLSASESEYSSVIESDMVVGVVPEFECEEGTSFKDVALNFKVKDENDFADTNDEDAAVPEDLKGIRKYNVFKYFDDIGMLLPVETTYDEINNTVTTHKDISSAKTKIGEENMRAIVVNNLGAHTSLIAFILSDKAGASSLWLGIISEVRTTPNINMILKITNYWEKQGLKDALDTSLKSSSEFNVYRCDYANTITDFWYQWDTPGYICKVDDSGNFYKITPYYIDDSAMICESLGWRKP